MMQRVRTSAAVGVPIAVGAACVVALLLLFFLDPESTPFPRCPVKTLTGLDCPGCGSQRAIHALLHGDVARAWHMNAFMVVMLPAVLALIVVELRRNQWPRAHEALTSRWVGMAAIVVAIGWTVWRNAF